MGMDQQDWKSLGNQILDSVSGALNSGDFSELNGLVADTVNSVVDEVRRQAERDRMYKNQDMIRMAQANAMSREKWARQQEEIRRRQDERREEWKNRHIDIIEREMTQQRNMTPAQERRADAQARRHSKAIFRRVGSVANVLNTVFGALGIGVTVAFAFFTLILFSIGEVFGPFLFLTIIFGLIFGKMLKKGAKQRGMLHRTERYIQLCGKKMYADVSELAAQTGKNVTFVRKDLAEILSAGLLPQGHMDSKKTCLMLTDEVYHQYMETNEAYKKREKEARAQKAQEESAQTPVQKQAADEDAGLTEQEKELKYMVREGMSYIQKLRDLNDAIPGEEISGRLYQLESLLKQIFERVQEHPEQMGRMQKMMEYYLPTMVKLVEAYVDFEKVEKPGPDIVNAKSEIYKTLGIINEAFEELLNNLFQDAVFDATTDAQVLQTMLAREGLRRELGAAPAMQTDAPQERFWSDGSASESAQETQEAPEPAPAADFRIHGIGEQEEIPGALKAPWES